MFRFLLAICAITGALAANPNVRRPMLTGRIVGGTPADIRDYPYQLSMEYLGYQVCGGSIINKDWAVTAAHCVVGSSIPPMSFRAGSSIREVGGSVHPFAEIHIHPNYDERELANDIAVVKVSVPFEYSNTVRPIKITCEAPPEKTPVVASGWGALSFDEGSPEQLQRVEVNIIDSVQCNDIYEPLYGPVTEDMICAGVWEGGKGVCYGDSGGPLVAGDKLVGIVSWGHECAPEGYPQVYANVANLGEWVTSVTGIKCV